MSSFTFNSYPLEGDGVIENLFHYLWYKDELNHGPNINIPDTIIYKYTQPAFWYFTSKDGTIKKKSKYNLTNIRIEEAFTRKTLGSDIVAYYISSKDGRADGQTVIEYFDSEGLSKFLYDREKVNNGILQKFIEPKGTSNVMIRGIWSPKVVMLERRENARKLNDKKYSLYERAVTYEGAEHNSRAKPVRGSLLPTEVQKICKDIVDHVAEVSFRKINVSRMALNFKVDPEGKVWCLWCTSLRMENVIPIRRKQPNPNSSSTIQLHQYNQEVAKQPSKQGPINLDLLCSVPDSIKKEFGVSDLSPVSPEPKKNRKTKELSQSESSKLSQCVSCGDLYLPDRFYEVSYKTIVAHFEQMMAVLAASSGGSMMIEWPPEPRVVDAFGGIGLFPLEKLREKSLTAKDKSKVIAAEDVEIPPILREQHPHLRCTEYRRYRKDPLFLYKSVVVCEDCYLVFAQVASSLHSTSTEMKNDEVENARLGVPSRLEEKRADDLEIRRRLRRNRKRAQEDHFSRNKPVQRKKIPVKKKKQMPKSKSDGKLKRFHGPSIPPRIDERNVSGMLNACPSTPELGATKPVQNAVSRQSRAFTADSSLSSSSSIPDSLRTTIQERENAFFRDLYKNPNLKHGHPLNHMITTHAKLSMAEAGANQVQDNAIPTPSIRKPLLAPVTPASPYAMSQITGKRTLQTSKSKKPKSGKGLKLKNQKLIEFPDSTDVSNMLESEYTVTGERKIATTQDSKPKTNTRKRRSIKTSEAISAAKHRDYLLNTYEQIQSELLNDTTLDESFGVGIAANVGMECVEKGISLGDAWEVRDRTVNDPEAETYIDSEKYRKGESDIIKQVGKILRKAIKIGDRRYMVAVDISKDDLKVTIFNPKHGRTQHIQEKVSRVIEALPNAKTSEEVAEEVIKSLRQSNSLLDSDEGLEDVEFEIDLP